jgi:hypothetical protein
VEFNGSTSTLATPTVDRTSEEFNKVIATEFLDHNSSAELSMFARTLTTLTVNRILKEFDKEIAAGNPGFLLTTDPHKTLSMLSMKADNGKYEGAIGRRQEQG